MKDRITSAKIDPATGRPLPAGVKYRAKGQYQARKRIAGGERIRPLTPGAARLLRALQAQRKSSQPGDLVFDIDSKDAFSVRFGRITKKAGLRDLTFHDLRHEATSRLARIYTLPPSNFAA